MQLTEFKSRLEERRQGIDGCIHIFSELNKVTFITNMFGFSLGLTKYFISLFLSDIYIKILFFFFSSRKMKSKFRAFHCIVLPYEVYR